ncbi:SusC/RagA family TonB-linked outer membrane protein [Pedobacter foliorum]|uniref:SusC/RagA family TonB-linked outer membrane protein n=1 Tax=Pedobacter foliorum TaxID=2739058 RepID=UPI0015671F21|nr:SusC/RagA family TonB-linked outer membrane protein [Pedobacter foliorum]NRF41971.1 SusC/RagA family TonB-linked outer membrane protein [Pedobacter foliorum]
MKLTILLLTTVILQLSANSFAQKITLSEKNAPLTMVFEKIRTQTGYDFLVTETMLKNAKPVSIQVNNEEFLEVLTKVFENQNLTFVIKSNSIIVKDKPFSVMFPRSITEMVIDISGKIVDEKGLPIPGVTIKVKGSGITAITNGEGKFSISAPQGSILQFSYIGYKSKEITVGASSTINISMEPSSNALQEVTVEGAMGIQKLDKNLGYSATRVGGEEINRTNTVNPIAALQGKVAGVNINVMSAAGVQTSPFIQIRGAKVLGNQPGQANNQPIFVVDGNVLMNNLSDADNADGGSQLKNLNPDDYESITVLKGAAATSIYGSRGLNGAIVITTKKGKTGSGLGIEINSTYQTQQIYKSPMAFQNVYGQGSALTREGNFAADGTQAQTVGSWGPAMDGSLHPVIFDPARKTAYSAQPDNWKTFYQNGSYVNNNIAIGGASDKFNYRLSYSNNSSKGMLPNNGLKRNSFDLKVGGEINKVFSTDFGISYANTKTSNYFSQGRYYYGGGQNLAFNTYYLPRNLDMQDWYNTYRNADNSVKPGAFGNLSSVVNAFSRFDKNNYTKSENSVLAYLQLKAQVTPWLDLSSRANINYQKTFGEEKNYGNDKDNRGGYYGASGSYSTDYTLLFMAHAAKKAFNDDLNIDLRIFNEIYGNRLSENYGASTNGGLAVPNQFFLGNSASNIQNNIYYNANGDGPSYPNLLTVGLAGVLNLNYKEYFNLELSGRNDWLSTLTYPVDVTGGANNNTVFYPAVNLSYSFYDHFKASMPGWLSSARLRASLAYVGNAGVAGAFSTGNGYSPTNIFNQNNQSVGSASQINADVRPNLNLKPQRQRSWEFGTNFGLIKELINVDFTWYKTNTINQLLNLPAVMETGYSKLFINAGNIQNKGLELLVNFTPLRGKDWGLDFAVNLAQNRSKIVSFGNGIKEWELSGGYDGANVYAYEGGEFGVLTGENWATGKVDSKTGLPLIEVGSIQENTNPNVKYRMQDYNLVTNDGGAEPRIKIGKVEPDLVGGITANLRYKNFSLFAQVDGRFGGSVYSESYSYAMGQGTLEQTLEFRDQAHGGVMRTDSYNGQTRYDGVIPNAVFNEGQMSPLKPGVSIAGKTFKQAYNEGLVEPWKASLYYNTFYGWGTNLNTNGSVTKNSWIMLREITLGYKLPNAIANSVHLRGARINFTARNIGYLYKTLQADQNPESLQSNDPFRPYITGGVPFYRNFAVSLNLTL